MQVPDRIVGDKVVVARPGADDAVVLGGAAALVWMELDSWMTESDLWEVVARSRSDIGANERRPVLRQALQMLTREGLLERRAD